MERKEKKNNCCWLQLCEVWTLYICFFHRCSLLFAFTRSVVTLRWSFFVHMPFALALLAVFFDNLPKQTKKHFLLLHVMKRQCWLHRIRFESEIVADDGWWWKSEAPEIFLSHVFCYRYAIITILMVVSCFLSFTTQDPESLIYYTRMTFA